MEYEILFSNEHYMVLILCCLLSEPKIKEKVVKVKAQTFFDEKANINSCYTKKCQMEVRKCNNLNVNYK